MVHVYPFSDFAGSIWWEILSFRALLPSFLSVCCDRYNLLISLLHTLWVESKLSEMWASNLKCLVHNWAEHVRFFAHTFSPVSNVELYRKDPRCCSSYRVQCAWARVRTCPLQAPWVAGEPGFLNRESAESRWCLLLYPLKAPHARRWVHLVCSRRGQTKGLFVVPGACVKTTKQWNFTKHQFERDLSEQWVYQARKVPKRSDVSFHRFTRAHTPTSKMSGRFHIWLVAEVQKTASRVAVYLHVHPTRQRNGWTGL